MYCGLLVVSVEHKFLGSSRTLPSYIHYFRGMAASQDPCFLDKSLLQLRVLLHVG